jgi:hypothetical protein
MIICYSFLEPNEDRHLRQFISNYALLVKVLSLLMKPGFGDSSHSIIEGRKRNIKNLKNEFHILIIFFDLKTIEANF